VTFWLSPSHSELPQQARTRGTAGGDRRHDRIETAKRRAGWTHDGIEPINVRWHTRNAGESAEFQIDVHETKDFDVNLFLSILYPGDTH
jgi:hypothetical protein